MNSFKSKTVISIIALSYILTTVASESVKPIATLHDAKIRIQYLESKIQTLDIKVMQLESKNRVLIKKNKVLENNKLKKVVRKKVVKQSKMVKHKLTPKQVKNRNDYKRIKSKLVQLRRELKSAQKNYRDFKWKATFAIKKFPSSRKKSSRNKKQPRGRSRNRSKSSKKTNSRDQRSALKAKHIKIIADLELKIRDTNKELIKIKEVINAYKR